MKPGMALILIFLIVLLVGCQKELKPSEMHPNDLPDERAFQDEFTREFLQSVEETRPGHYSFLSKTGRYKMDFPGEGVINKHSYIINNKSHETFNLTYIDEDNIKIELSLAYYIESYKEDMDINIAFFQGRLGVDEKFEITDTDNRTIYYTDYNISKYYKHAAYIQNDLSPGGIEMIVTIHCNDESLNNCNNNARNESIEELIMSTHFVTDKVGDD